MATLQEAADRLSEMGDRRGLEEKLSGIETIDKDSTVREEQLRKRVNTVKPGRVAGIDGGLVKKRYASGDLVAVRAVAAVLEFPGPEAEYIPSRSPEPDFHVFNSGDSRGLDRRAETERVRAEAGVTLDAVAEAEDIFVDGSIVPSYLEEREVLEKYEHLFDQVEEGALVGVVEDSHGLKLSQILEEKLGLELGELRDTVIMDALLEEGERSFVRRYSDSPVEHPVLKKLDERHANRVNTFHVKLSERDVPLRIDYYGKKEHADRIAGLLMSLK
ncbi:MAG: DNA double-strand break repair nuclease NurA, partial [Candidatus Nanohaloarchaea archaeon]